jgi:uncharacterized protein YyaL (SSP411 family)
MAFDRQDWIARAQETADFIVTVTWSSDRRLARTATAGVPGGQGLLEGSDVKVRGVNVG